MGPSHNHRRPRRSQADHPGVAHTPDHTPGGRKKTVYDNAVVPYGGRPDGPNPEIGASIDNRDPGASMHSIEAYTSTSNEPARNQNPYESSWASPSRRYAYTETNDTYGYEGQGAGESHGRQARTDRGHDPSWHQPNAAQRNGTQYNETEYTANGAYLSFNPPAHANHVPVPTSPMQSPRGLRRLVSSATNGLKRGNNGIVRFVEDIIE
jgi:hypothetical protein